MKEGLVDKGNLKKRKGITNLKKRKGITWKTVRLTGLLTTEEMLYVLDEKNLTKVKSLKRRHLVARFKRSFRNHSLADYLQYKDYILFQSHFDLEKERVPKLDALLLLDFHYIARAKKVRCSQ